MNPKRSKSINLDWLIRRLYRAGIGISILLWILTGNLLAAAQDDNTSWSAPVNLSQSGGTTNPILLVDTNGLFHVFWQESPASYVYQNGDGVTWNASQSVTFPFTPRDTKLSLLAAPDGRMYALWIGADSALYSSRVLINLIAYPDEWSTAIRVSSSVIGFDADIDAEGEIHLAYIRGRIREDVSAGVYYLQLANFYKGLSKAKSLYQSSYFRTLTSHDANIDLAAVSQGGQTALYVAWDNRPRERLFFTQSFDRGVTWNDPMELVSPSTDFGNNFPYHVQIAANQSQVLALWQLGIPGEQCTQYYQWTTDQGVTWGTQQVLFDPQAGCPQQNQLLVTSQGEMLMFTVLNGQEYLLAWNGTTWSALQQQSEFSSFSDPETNRSINFQCMQMLEKDGSLYLVGCDPDGSNDIWLTSRSLGNTASWFTTPSTPSEPEVTPGGNNTPAQSGSTSWNTPTNLSQSGGTTNPFILIDFNGMTHVFWLDMVAGYVYKSGDEQNWAAAQGVAFPFPIEASKLSFVAAQDGRVYAFWIDPERALYTSSASVSDIADAKKWSSSKLISSSVLGFDTTVDAGGILHLAYLRGGTDVNEPAGVYYLQLIDYSSGWSIPTSLYQSPYFRTLTPDEINIDITTATQENQTVVYLAWDNRPQQRILFARSINSGAIWDGPRELVSPSIDFGFDRPYNVQIAANQSQVLALWQLGTPGEQCTQYYQWSPDQGETWKTSQALFGLQAGCPQKNQLLITSQGEMLLFTLLNNQGYLSAWNGYTWSTPQQQNEFSSFYNPETNRLINFQCMQMVEKSGYIYLIGCDPDSSNDIWLTSRILGNTASWFPSPSTWSKPEVIAVENYELSSAKLVTDSAGHIHAFWNRITSQGTDTHSAIEYSIWDGINWSHPVRILGLSWNSAYLHSVAINPDDILLVVWEGKTTRGVSDGLFISVANNAEAFSASAWISSDALPTQGGSATSPEVIINDQGKIYIIYVLPLNENRGVYIITSTDNGRTWSAPIMIADAITQEWDMVKDPQIAASPNGHLVTLWTEYTLPPDAKPLTLYSATSQDDGATWSSPEIVSDQRIGWSQIVSLSENTFFRLWQENDPEIQYLWYQYSTDYGITWSTAYNLSTTEENIRAVTAFVDAANQIHWIVLSEASQNSSSLRHWVWKGDQWVGNESLAITDEITIQPGSLSSALTINSVLGTIYTSEETNLTADQVNYQIDFTKRIYELPSLQATVTPTVSETPTEAESTPQPTATQAPSANPTLTTSQSPAAGLTPSLRPTNTSSGPGQTPATSSPKLGPWLGLVIGGGILLGGGTIALFRSRKMRKHK